MDTVLSKHPSRRREKKINFAIDFFGSWKVHKMDFSGQFDYVIA